MVDYEKIGEAIGQSLVDSEGRTDAKLKELGESVSGDLQALRADVDERLQPTGEIEALEEKTQANAAEIAQLAEKITELLSSDDTDEKIDALGKGVSDVLESLREELEERLSQDDGYDATEKRSLANAIEIKDLSEKLAQYEVLEARIDSRLAEVKDGQDGIQGEPGLDGLDKPLLEPVELVDKGYPKSTLGLHEGGLWIATKEAVGSPESDPLAWSCILDAMTTLSVDMQEDRSYKLSVRMATGKVIESDFSIPFPEHAGIWEEGSYTKGSIVTKGHSFWMALEDTDGVPPGNGWQQILSAPRGKQGPAGKSIQGPQGVPGRNGLDAKLPPNFVEDVLKIASTNKAFEDGRSGAEAITSFRGYFMPNESYNRGDVVDHSGSLYLFTTGGTFSSPAAASQNWTLFCHVPQSGPLPAYALWRGEWQSGVEYQVGNMVKDGAWLMSCIHTTTERAAPQAIGSEFNIYQGTDPTPVQSAKSLTHGQTYTAHKRAWINGYRIYTVSGNSYRVYSVSSEEQISEMISFTASTTGWVDFTMSPRPVPLGKSFSIISVVAEPDPSPTSWTADFAYDTPKKDENPDPGVIIHPDDNQGLMRISKTDNDTNDVSTQLEALSAGDIIDSGNIRWTIQSTQDQVDHMLFGVAPAIQDGNGVKTFTFETVTATPITYLDDPDYYVGNDSVTGLYGVDVPYDELETNDTAYGVDLTVQEASISDHWEMMSYSSEATVSPSSAAAGAWRNEADDLGQGAFRKRIERLESLVSQIPGLVEDI